MRKRIGGLSRKSPQDSEPIGSLHIRVKFSLKWPVFHRCSARLNTAIWKTGIAFCGEAWTEKARHCYMLTDSISRMEKQDSLYPIGSSLLIMTMNLICTSITVGYLSISMKEI